MGNQAFTMPAVSSKIQGFGLTFSLICIAQEQKQPLSTHHAARTNDIVPCNRSAEESCRSKNIHDENAPHTTVPARRRRKRAAARRLPSETRQPATLWLAPARLSATWKTCSTCASPTTFSRSTRGAAPAIRSPTCHTVHLHHSGTSSKSSSLFSTTSQGYSQYSNRAGCQWPP
jgi:hypothetical protein